MEEIELFLEEARELMAKAVGRTENELTKIRAGKANPAMLKGVMVNYYETMTPLDQVSSISTPDARTINVKPWEKSLIADIEAAIMNSDLGLNPTNNGEMIIINVPALTEERRIELTKQAKSEAENGRVSVRNVRKDINSGLKSLLKDGVSEDAVKGGEDEVQKLTDQHISKIDSILSDKEADIMTI